MPLNSTAMLGAANANAKASARKSVFIEVLLFRECRVSCEARLAAHVGRIEVRKTFGHGRRGKRDDQGQGDQKLLHSRSPSDVTGLGDLEAPAGRPRCGFGTTGNVVPNTRVQPIPYRYRMGAFAARNSVGLSSPKPTGISV